MEVEKTETPASIEKFIRHSQELTPLLSQNSDGGEGWDDDIPPGQELQDYRRDPNVAIPLPPPPPLFRDPGKTPNALLEHRPPSPKDVQDPSAAWGVCGLLNMGNTCYMNAGLQCIRNIPDIARYYLDSKFSDMQVSSSASEDSKDKLLACKGHLSARFSTLVQKLWSSQFSALHPKAFKTTLGLLHPQFGDNRQQDCQEFLAMLLDTLHEDAISSDHCHTSKLPNSDCNHEGEGMEEDEPANQIPAADESHDPAQSENSDPSAQSHDQKKPSVVTETFQGMLRNEVVCSTCNHLSTKVEPFIYLSVPLPHAYERQIEIHWIPLCARQGERVVTKLLVTVLRDVSVGEVKDALLLLIGRELSHDLLVLVEVKEKSIVRVLSDSFSLKQLADGSTELYVFEMAPVEGAGSVEFLQAENSQPTPEQMGYQPLGGSEIGPIPSPTVSAALEPNQDPWMPVTGHPPSHAPTQETSQLDAFGSEHFTSSGDGVSSHGGKHSKESDSEGEVIPAKMMRREEVPVESHLSASPTPEAMDCNIAQGDSPSANTESNTGVAVSAPAVSGASDPQPPVRAVVMEWHSCSICLEEMVDSELLIHHDCGAIVCPTCLQASSEHYSQGGALMPCPICSTMVSPSQAFRPLATLEESQVIRLLQTNILFRREAYDGSVELFGHPALLNLPSSDKSSIFYSTISALLAPPTIGREWKLCLTDAKGRFCSRCLFGSGCRGCVIADCDVPLQLKPGDHIAVTFPLLPSVTAEMASRVEAHPSLEQRREQQLTLEECLQAFSQRELLGADNPWLCPRCGQAREAMRTLAVCALPRTLIIHLKRFIFHGSSSSKVDAPVSFPHQLDPWVVGRTTEEEEGRPLELVAFVCHFGTLHCGHYTAYSRHPSSGEWWCYNDETVTKGEPTEKDMEKAYILFYQHKGPTPLTLPEVTASFDDSTEMKSVEQLLRLFKPHPSLTSRAPPPMPPKKASSESDLTGGGGELVSAQASAIISALGLEPSSLLADSSKPSVPPPLTRASSNPQIAASTATQSNVGHKVSLLEDYRNYDFSPEVDDPVSSATGGVQLLSVKMKSW